MGRRQAVPGVREYEQWLESCGWKLGRGHLWIEPASRGIEWTFRGALRIAAEAEAARMLRALGWYAANEYGKTCIGHLCRAPGTWEPMPPHGGCRGIKGSGGRWLGLSGALRAAGLRYVEAPSGGALP